MRPLVFVKKVDGDYSVDDLEHDMTCEDEKEN
jgi:hypothetical protein